MTTEQEQFGHRLCEILDNHGLKDSPTQLQRIFNASWHGQPITVHAVRKWLMGQAIPTQAKLKTLASVLGADVNWLRYGGAQVTPSGQVSFGEAELVGLFRTLLPSQRDVLLRVARAFKDTL